MGHYAVRRVLFIFPTLLVASLLVATIVRLLPGDVVNAIAGGGRGGSAVQREEVREYTRARLGLDAPFHVQYIRWMFGWPTKEGSIFKTSDGGATWKRSGAEVVKPISRVTFLSPTLGWGLAETRILATSDGGLTWLRQHKGDSSLNALFLLDEKFGWAVGDQGTIFYTSEGGERQRTEEGLSAPSWTPQETDVTDRLTDVVFVDADTGWVVGDKGAILHTANGGAEWVAQSSRTDVKLSSAAFFDSHSGWAVGEKGTILTTSDGGQTWLEQVSGTNEDLNDISFADSSRIWAVGDKGTVLHSSNGGYTWAQRTISDDINRELTSVAFDGESNGMIAGEKGVILATTDGGASWSRQEIILTRTEGGVTTQQRPISKPIKDISLVVSGTGTIRAWAPAVETSWKWGVVGGNMGERFLFGRRPITGEILRALGPSLELMILSMAIILVVAIPIGVYSAIRQDTIGDYIARTFAITGLAIPVFWMGTMVILIATFQLGWVPKLTYVSFFDDPRGNLYFFMLPALVAAYPTIAEVMRMTRSMMLEVMRQDYVRTAWSKGLRERSVIVRHSLKNAMIPVITLIGLDISFQLGGLVVIETIFNSPGLGRLLLQAIETRDFPLVQGVALFLGAVLIFTNLVVDLTYSWLDPRIRYN